MSMSAKNEVSIWFFNGIQLLVNGVLIFGAGVYQYVYPPAEKVTLFDLHAGVWWGAVLAVLGLVYTVRYRPNRPKLDRVI
jgi:hypothetical protein